MYCGVYTPIRNGSPGRTLHCAPSAGVEGANPVEIAEELGHSLATLLAVYSHVIRCCRGKLRQTAEDTIREARLPKICPPDGRK